jgi:hypothetical protein
MEHGKVRSVSSEANRGLISFIGLAIKENSVASSHHVSHIIAAKMLKRLRIAMFRCTLNSAGVTVMYIMCLVDEQNCRIV